MSKEAVDGVSRRELFRQASKYRLIEEIEKWMSFHFARNETSHSYSSETADQIYLKSAEFIPEARKLLIRLQATND